MYTAANASVVAQAKVDTIANNLANVNTPGFKRTLLQVQSLPTTELYRIQNDPGKLANMRTSGVPVQVPVGPLGFGSEVYDTPAIFDQGPMQATGNPLDVALSGTGFFAVRNAQTGAISYTRDGSFVQNAQGQLLTMTGDAVLDANGAAITLQPQSTVSIDRAGTITTTTNQGGVPQTAQAGKLGIYEFGNLTALRPQGASKFIDAGAQPQPAANTTVLQGKLEQSNASVVGSIVDLIVNQRWFDANNKMIQTQDAEVGNAINVVGKSS
jgi:flagellar basal-body rod protein FlgG